MTAADDAQRVIVRGAGSNALSFVLRFGARALFLWSGARLYGAAGYGVFTLATAVVELAVPLASLGLKRMIFPWLEAEARGPGDEPGSRPAGHVVADALLLAMAGSAVLAGAIALLALVLPDGAISPALRTALLILAPAVAGQVIADVALAATRWTHRMRYEVAGRGVIEPYVGTAVAVAAWSGGLLSDGLLIAYWCGSLAVAGYALWAARDALGGLALRTWRIRPRQLAARVAGLLPASGSDALTSLAQRVDLYLVGLFLGDAAAGIYGVVRQLRTPILQVRQAFDGILTPIIARTLSNAGDVETGAATAAATRLILTLQLAVVLFMAAAGEPLLELFGAKYGSGYASLVALVLAEALNGAFGVSEMILYFRRPALALAVNAVLIVVPVVVVAVLAATLGMLAAALGVLLAATIAALLRRRWLEQFGVQRPALHAWVPPAAAALGGGLGLLVRSLLLSRPALPPLAPTALPVLVALGLYGIAIRLWLLREPQALSLARFRVH